MTSFEIRLQSLLRVAFLSIASLLMGSAGATVHNVGNNFGWKDYSGYNYQTWASSIQFKINDTLNFGSPNPEYPVYQVKSSTTCETNVSLETPLKANSVNGLIEYNLTSAGPICFSSDFEHCQDGMTFNVTTVSPFLNPAQSPYNPGSSNPSSPSPSKDSHGKNGVGWIVGVVTGVTAVLALMAVLAVWKRPFWQRLTKPNSHGPKGDIISYAKAEARSRSHSWLNKDIESGNVSESSIEWPWSPQRFSYKKLNDATNSFNSSLVVGEGGFGTVYKGYMPDSPGSPPVAVKRLSQYARQGAREFMAELNIISQLRHRNLVQLVGWCDESEELLLVYEYMPNGDLDDLIFGGYQGDQSAEFTPLSWKHRHNTFCGVATALVYLHEEWEQRVVHRDVKTSNVMLDSQFNARLGDFGLARLSAHSQAPRTTLVAGTIGYLAPEFNLTGKATDKTDVYAFGVVVLEVSCARRPLTTNCILVDWVWDLHKEDKLLDAVDHKLDVRSPSDEEEMKRALRVGLLCCHPDPGARPTMRHVLNILTGESPLPKMPRSRPVAVFTDDPQDRF